MSIRRMAVFIAVNAVVSALVVLIVLSLWESSRSPIQPIPTLAPTSIVIATAKPIGPTATPIVPRSYIVQSGDSLAAIVAACRQLGVEVSVEDVQRANSLEPDRLRVGQKLFIPAPRPRTGAD